jgi:ferric-dicitrate binding protein FerR (iron transport regulator)
LANPGDPIIQQLLSKPVLMPEEEAQLRLLLESDFQQNLQYVQPVNVSKAQQILVKIHAQMAAENSVAPLKKPAVLYRWLAVAAMLLLLAAGWWYFTNTAQKATTGNLAKAIAPGHSGAVLTLADGRQVTLDSMGNGLVAHENGASVTLNNHQLIYDQSSAAVNNAIAMNLLSTPRSRQFQLVLPDGTKVWLNAASSIRYPVAFTGRERKVEITGEAYLEVAQQSSAPFIVTAGNMQLQVLGTAFNVNAYADEPAIVATLAEGSVNVVLQPAAGQKPAAIVLKPGQQARIDNNITLAPRADLSAVLAWKNGQFSFEQAGVAEVMRQITRWYNVEVRYEGVPPHREFHGGIGRDFTLQQVLDALEKTGVHCRLEDRTVIVEKSPV